MNRYALLALLFLSSLVLAQEGQTYAGAIKAARESAWSAITNGRGSAASVAIMHKGKLVYSAGMGVKDWASDSPVTSRTRFNIGSTSKMFAAVAVLMLVDQGKVELDAPVTRYVPDFEMADPRYRDITVRMLFNHSSGLAGSSFTIGYDSALDLQGDLLETLRWQHLKHAPGAMSMYCNDGFTLAEIVVARVSGERYLDFLQKRVLDPLGMRDTGASLGELPPGVDRAEFIDRKTGKQYPAEILEVHGAGGLSSTPEDLCRFGNSLSPLADRRLLSDASLKVLRATQPTAFTGKLRNRQMWSELAWDYSNKAPFDARGLQVLGKGGNTLCYSTNLQIVPDQGLTLAMCVSGGASGEMMTDPIMTALLEDLELVDEGRLGVSKLPAKAAVPDEIRQFAGVYAGDADRVVKVSVSEDGQTVLVVPARAKGGGEDAPPLFTLSYHEDGILRQPGKLACYFAEVDGVSYVISTPMTGVRDVSTIYAVDYVMLQRLEVPSRPGSLEVDMVGRPWLVRNAPPRVSMSFLTMIVAPTVYEDLPGYLDFSGIKRVESPSWAGMAATHFRDQSEMRLLDGGARAQVGPWLYTPGPAARGVLGENAVVIGGEGENEWLEVPAEAVFQAGVPEGGRVAVVTTGGDILFDSLVDSSEVLLPQGALIFCAGPAGSRFSLSLR